VTLQEIFYFEQSVSTARARSRKVRAEAVRPRFVEKFKRWGYKFFDPFDTDKVYEV